jgi:Zn-dependent peptidase ImmA (M78 family)/DNA-binding XRE family transcriptional regulator
VVLDLDLLASKLRRYREQFQATISEVSSATGISEDSLTAFENAEKQPTGDEILILADFYKCDYKFFISGEQLAAFEQTETLFRKHGEQLSKEDRWAIQEFLYLCECEEFLMRILPVNQRKPFIFIKQGSFYKGHGEAAAAKLRRNLGYAPNMIGMDVYDEFRRIGLHVFRRHLDNSEISGLFIKHPIAGKCVLVNYSEDIYRQRFSAAHEAAHAILDEESDSIISFKWDTRDLNEVRANTFASRYLMPPAFLRVIPDPAQWDSEKAIEWANKLKVSTEALAYALKDADLVSDHMMELIKSVKVPAEQKADPELPGSLSEKSRERKRKLLRIGLSDFYVGLCFDAYEKAKISAGRLSEMLLINEQELPSLAALYSRSLSYGD